ncbi:MAG: hypothetical protein WC861_04410 [Candidatus Micrarchaeia archaeon]|jgi:hypothetical protein
MKLGLEKNRVSTITGSGCLVFSKLRKAFCSFRVKREEIAGSAALADTHRKKARELEKGADGCSDQKWALAAAARCDEAGECNRLAGELRNIGNEEAAIGMEERAACAIARAAAMTMNMGRYDEALALFQKAEAQLGSVVKGYIQAGNAEKAKMAGSVLVHVQNIIRDYNGTFLLMVDLPATFPF